jgi:hypothetical protein
LVLALGIQCFGGGRNGILTCCSHESNFISIHTVTLSKGIPRQAEVALGVPGRLRRRIFSTFGTTRVVCRQPDAPVAFTPGEVPGIHFQMLSRPQGTWFCRKEPRKKSQVTTPVIDPGIVRLVAQSLNHYATPGPIPSHYLSQFSVHLSLRNKIYPHYLKRLFFTIPMLFSR